MQYINKKILGFRKKAAFLDMPSNLVKIKYPSEQQAQMIEINLNTNVNFIIL